MIAVKLKAKIQEISLNLVNEKTKGLLGKIEIADFDLRLIVSQKRMMLSGTNRQLCFIDYSAFPFTIIEEQEDYGKGSYLIKGEEDRVDSMIAFDIEMLNLPDQNQKKMFINLSLNNF